MSLFPLLTSPKSLFSNHSKAVFLGTFAVLVALATGTVFAEDAKPFRTARLTYLAGDVRVEQNGTSSGSKAVVNLPLVEGAVLSTGDDGQAEVEFEDGSLLRLTPHSGTGLVNLGIDSSGEYQTRIAILGGLAYVELRGGTKYHYLVDAGGDELSPVENVIARINFDQPPASISILDGSAHLVAASGSDVSATAGQTVRAGDESEGGAYMAREIVAPESWDQWNLDRDAAAAGESGSETDVRSKYAGDQGYGWSDLDANGNWYNVPGQGEMWQPDAAAQSVDDGSDDASAQTSFDPYSYGSWAYTPAGYVWASGYGWGWLPYHCGNWNYWDGFGWAWSPGLNCGAFGFGGYSDGGVYIGRAPVYYKKPGRPLPKPGPVHPILRGRGGPMPVAPVHPIKRPNSNNPDPNRLERRDTGERVIAGIRVMPLPRAGGQVPAHDASSNARATVGAGLRRDYAADPTGAPVTGVQPSTLYGSPSSNARAPWHPAQSTDGTTRQSTVVQRPGYSAPEGGSRPVPVVRSAPVLPQRPPAPAPAPRAAPAPAPRPAPAASAGHPK
ncbi:hypothetical protein HDF16_003641 [Granulicella aggregans]|uniref:FecR family protein n=1 Tax=Granulicella aggregans TaxID=474949 RepID=A0A7W7ZFR7_9BACT|nr:DUF6600 domain-containing protein [Granulicella aggregans]MBB5058918.1 hypothetical protein [Granulicella aggregans]